MALAFSLTDAHVHRRWNDLRGARPTREWKPLLFNGARAVLSALHQKLHCVIPTEGDGACSLHGAFGTPALEEPHNLFAPNARARLVATLGRTAAEFREHLHNEVLFMSVVSDLWKDGLHPILLRECKSGEQLRIRKEGWILWNKVSANRQLQENTWRMFKNKCTVQSLSLLIVWMLTDALHAYAHPNTLVCYQFSEGF